MEVENHTIETTSGQNTVCVLHTINHEIQTTAESIVLEMILY